MENQENRKLIQTLLDCALACENCAANDLYEEDVNDMRRCITLDRDCADICMLAAKLLGRNSDIAYQYLLLCEEICRMCGEECGKHNYDHCKKCAESCEACADACHERHEPITQD